MALDNRSNILFIFILGLAAVLLQAFFIPLLEIGVWRPNIILLVVIYVGFRYGVITGVITGFILGIFQDSMSPLPIGISSMANSIIGFGTGQIRQLKLSYNAKVLAAVILILIQGCIFYFFYQIQSELTYIYLLLTRVFPNTIYTFFIGLLISFFMKKKLEDI